MTRTLRLVLTALCGGALLAGCGTSDPVSVASPRPSAAASSASTDHVLELGKSALQLAAGRYRSPEGFQPALRLTIPDGWTSTHRSSDAFDLGQPDPQRDAPLIAVVFLAAPAPSASAALDAVRKIANGTVQPATADIGGVTAQGIDVTGGSGQLIASADRAIALDAAPRQRVRLVAVDMGGHPLMVAILVPDGSQWEAAWAQAAPLLAVATPA